MLPGRSYGHFWDHKDAVCIFRHQSMSACDLEMECQGVRGLVKASRLLSGGPQMTFIYDDAQHILGLNMQGTIVLKGNYTKELDWEQLHVLTKKLFGWAKKL
ncbi:hypothetical protein C5167_050313 [Papaver somniferum]|uniref:Uncharacterized protein n=1 Tax=Papaver somniferum TaxID=3469 RepID=A0A4Y7KR20_PAPSO|nr:hypothetical protein C5167_050313 [Papaver somniferum]